MAGERGETIILAGQAIRGVALGVGVTAIVQTVLGGIGLAIAGVPGRHRAQTAADVMIAAAGLVLAPFAGRLSFSGRLMRFGSFSCASGDCRLHRTLFCVQGLHFRSFPVPRLYLRRVILRPGFGLLAFVGPVVLAVTYTLLEAWMADVPDRKRGGNQSLPQCWRRPITPRRSERYGRTPGREAD